MTIETNQTLAAPGSTTLEVQDTSIAALESIDPALKVRRKQKILDHIKSMGGATCYEIETEHRLLHQSASAAITYLRRTGRTFDTGQRRLTNTGRKAIVWGVVQ